MAVLPGAGPGTPGGEAARGVPSAGLDALTLAATILTVVLIDADVFDEVFRDAVQVNAEGITVFDEQGNSTGHALVFSEQNVTRCSNVNRWHSRVLRAWRWPGGTGSGCWPGSRLQWLGLLAADCPGEVMSHAERPPLIRLRPGERCGAS